MPSFLIISLIVLCVILALINFPVNLEFLFEIDNDLNKKSKINLSIFGGRIKFKIPDFKRKNAKEGLDKTTDNKNSSDTFITKFKELEAILDKILKTYNGSKKHIKKRIIVSKLDFYIKFGLFDAAQTGILTGWVWSVLYMLYAFVCENAVVKKHNFQVEPDFDEFMFELKSSGIIKLTLVNIISIAFRIFINYKKIIKNKEV